MTLVKKSSCVHLKNVIKIGRPPDHHIEISGGPTEVLVDCFYMFTLQTACLLSKASLDDYIPPALDCCTCNHFHHITKPYFATAYPTRLPDIEVNVFEKFGHLTTLCLVIG